MLGPECIPDDVLQSLTVGDLSEEKAAFWEEHLLDCPECLARTRSVCKADTLVDALRASRHLQESADEAAAVEALKQRLVEASREDVMSSAPTAASEVDQPTFLSSPSPVTAAPTVQITGTAAIVPGNLFGPYRILKKLGEGGMGAVYQAMHTRLDKVVALKVLPSQVTRHQAAVARFEREMRAVGKLEHPHIVRAMDAGEIDGTHYLAMEYVEGTDLAQLVKNRGPLSVVNGCKAIRQAALALAAAHAAGLVHRDLKPANLLVGKNGQIKLLDLGLARLADDTAESSELTSAGQAFGTPDFMAPEQWEDAHTTDARADLYALGCTLYYVLTGRPPYGGDRYKTTVAKFRGHVNDPIPDLAEARPDVPAAVVDIYQKLMAKSPADRYQTAAEVVASLQPFSSSKVANPESLGAPGTGLALSTGMVTSAELSPSAASLPDTLPSASSGRSGRRPRTLVMAGAGGLLLLAAGIIVTITNKDGTKSTFNVPEGIELDVDAAPGSKVAIKQVASPASSHTQSTTLASQSDWHGWPADAPKPAIAPFDAAQAKRHQDEWAAYLKVPVEYTNSIGMKFRLVPPGEFVMGSTPDEIEAALKVSFDDQHWRECIQSGAPQHKVILTWPIFVGITEVTQMQYERVTATNPSYFSATGTGKEAVAGLETGHYPAEMVSWNGATQFCAKLSEQESLKPSYRIVGESVVTVEGDGYRLPTEAEWEFVCRAGTTTQFWSGDDPDSLLLTAWFGGNSGAKTHPVGEADANPFGLFDVHGNVWEWVQDSWDPAYYGTFTDRAAVNPMPSFSAGDQRVVRGGHWSAAPTYCRASLRFASLPTSQTHLVGFRTVLTVDAVRQAHCGDKISGDEGGVPPMRPGPQGVITAPLAIDEPPPLKEWLKGRKVLTVAQDGTGQFKTIQAALDALQPGEVVKVLDKGPYPERLVMDSLPKDTGLISEVQTVLDLPEWKLGWNEPGTRPGQTAEIFQGHWLHRTNGFRLHGFELRFPPAVGTYSDGKWHRRMSANQTREFVLENCLIRALGEVDGEPIIFNSWDGEDREGMKVVVRDCVIEGSVTIMNPDKPRFSEPGLSTAVVTRNLFAGIEIDHYLIASGQSFEAFVVRQNVFSGKASNDIVLSKMGECTSLEWGQNTSVSETAIAVVSAMPLQTMTIRNNLRSRPSLVRLFPGAGRKTERVPTPWTIDHNRYPDPPDESVSANLLPRAPGDLSVPPRFLSTVPQESDYLRLDPNDPLAHSGAGGEWPSYIGALPPGPAPQEGDWFTRLRERWGDLKPGTPAEQE
ncbi:MAG: SUMF1/EgtB/PvdO family nonheme iron enzyme [Planctomycetaceae bacterium]|nr:SUMF1/EgtB/PvdO family nonheme iron enzyme [Planctomycetaceae bacterium]